MDRATRKAQLQIQDAMREFSGGGRNEPPTQTVSYGNYKKLSRHQIDQGVIALVLQLNLSGGSICDMDLYKLVRTYLWDEEARANINEIVDDKRLN